jgi:hypothetical protein
MLRRAHQAFSDGPNKLGPSIVLGQIGLKAVTPLGAQEVNAQLPSLVNLLYIQ